jgi:hypothetical protein
LLDKPRRDKKFVVMASGMDQKAVGYIMENQDSETIPISMAT